MSLGTTFGSYHGVFLSFFRYQPAGVDSNYTIKPVFFFFFHSQHRYMWFSEGGNYDIQISQTETWGEIPGLSLKFDLPEPANVRVLYSISVMPDQNFAYDGEI